MSVDYLALQAMAAEQIEAAGRIVQLVRVTEVGPSYNRTRQESAPVDISAVILSYESNEVDGARVLSSDLSALVAGTIEPAPTAADKILDGGNRYQIVPPVQELRPGDVALTYTLQLRQES